MNLVSIRIITADVRKMVAFYEQVTGLAAVQYTEDFAELQTGSARTLQLFGGDDVAETARNRSAIIEFLTKDVDETYDRLKGLLQDCLVQKPTTMPWGNKSLLFRDPDGNLVNFFTPVSPEAIKNLLTLRVRILLRLHPDVLLKDSRKMAQVGKAHLISDF